MRSLKDYELEQLSKKNFLELDGHPSVEAYLNMFTSPSADFCPLAIALEEHGRDCPTCRSRYKEALDILFPKKAEN